MKTDFLLICGGCGRINSIETNGKTANQIEAQISNAIKEGWRYASWSAYICPECRKDGMRYMKTMSKPELMDKTKSYMRLAEDTAKTLRIFDVII